MKYVRDTEGIIRFGARLRQLRVARQWTQEELAEKSGFEFSQIGRIERGVINTSISSVFILAKTLQVDAAELFNFSDLG